MLAETLKVARRGSGLATARQMSGGGDLCAPVTDVGETPPQALALGFAVAEGYATAEVSRGERRRRGGAQTTSEMDAPTGATTAAAPKTAIGAAATAAAPTMPAPAW